MISKGKMQSARGKMNVREQERPHHHFEFCNLHFSLSNKYLHFVRNFPEQSQDRLGLVRCQAAHATGRRDETLPEMVLRSKPSFSSRLMPLWSLAISIS